MEPVAGSTGESAVGHRPGVTRRSAPDGAWLGRLVIAGVLVLVVLPIVPLALYSFAGRWLYPDLVPAER